MALPENIKAGQTGCYIRDLRFQHLAEIPVSVAIEWVKHQFPDLPMSATGRVTAAMLTVDENVDTDAAWNGWLNKKYVIVGTSNYKWLAVAKYDDKFCLYRKDY